METTALAMYIDLENLPKGVDFDLLMEQAASDTAKYVYAVKAAYGSAVALPKQYRQQLLDHNFQIVDTPHIAKKKNRADLIISIDAFERLHLNRPSIDRYVFVTSDSDFSVIMDKLRIYGKQVWMVCRKADQAKKILSRCCDQMLSIEDFIPPPPLPAPKVDVEKDRLAERLFKEALRQIGTGNLPVGLSTVGTQMKKIHQGFDFKSTRFKRLTDLTVHFENAGVVRLGTNAKGLTQIEDVDDAKLEDEEVAVGVAVAAAP
jgi:hypothetical protein